MYIPDLKFALLMAQLEDLKELQKEQASNEDERCAADLREENAKLRRENTQLRDHVRMAENAVRELEVKRGALVTRLEKSAMGEEHVFKLFLRCISTRAANVFYAHGVTTLAGVVELLDKPGVKNFGARTRLEVRQILEDIGFGVLPDGEVEWTL